MDRLETIWNILKKFFISADAKRHDSWSSPLNDNYRYMAEDDSRRLQDWHKNQMEDDDRRRRMAEDDDRQRSIADDDWRRSQDDWHTQSNIWDHSSSSSSWNND